MTEKDIKLNIVTSTADFDKGINGVKKSLSDVESEVKKSTSKMAAEQKNYVHTVESIKKELLAKEQAILNKQLQQMQTALNKELAAVKGNAQKEFEVKQKYLKEFNSTMEKAQGKMKALGPATEKAAGGIENLGASIAGGEASIEGMGGQLSNLVSGFGPLGAAAGAAIGIVTALIGNIETAAEAAKRTAEEYKVAQETFESVATAITDINAAVSSGDMAAASEALKGNLDEVKAISTSAASELQALLDSPASQTAEGLARIAELTTQINDLSRENLLVAQYDAAVASLENIDNSVSEVIDKQKSWWQSAVEFISPAAEAANEMSVMADLTAKAEEKGIEGMKARAELRKIENNYQSVILENLKAGQDIQAVVNSIVEERGVVSQEELKIIVDQAGEAKKIYDLEEETKKAKEEAVKLDEEKLKIQVEYANSVAGVNLSSDLTEKEIVAAHAKLEAKKEELRVANEQLDIKIQELKAETEQLSVSIEKSKLDGTDTSASEAKLATLKAQETSLRDQYKTNEANIKTIEEASKKLKEQAEEKFEAIKQEKDAQKKAIDEKQKAEDDARKKKAAEDKKLIEDTKKKEIDTAKKVQDEKNKLAEQAEQKRQQAAEQRAQREMERAREVAQASAAYWDKYYDEQEARQKEFSSMEQSNFEKVESARQAIRTRTGGTVSNFSRAQNFTPKDYSKLLDSSSEAFQTKLNEVRTALGSFGRLVGGVGEDLSTTLETIDRQIYQMEAGDQEAAKKVRALIPELTTLGQAYKELAAQQFGTSPESKRAVASEEFLIELKNVFDVIEKNDENKSNAELEAIRKLWLENIKNFSVLTAGDREEFTKLLTAAKAAASPDDKAARDAFKQASLDRATAEKIEIDKAAAEAMDAINRRIEEWNKTIGSAIADFANIVDGDVKGSISSLGESIGTLLSKTASDADKTAAKIKSVAAALSILANIDDVVTGIQESFKEKGAGGVVSNIASYFTQVGLALLNSGVPGLTVAGAVILAVGIIGDLIGKLIALVETPEKRALRVSEERLDIQEKILGEYERQGNAVANLTDLESDLVDSAQERLNLLNKSHNQVIASGKKAHEDAIRSKKDQIAAFDVDIANAAMHGRTSANIVASLKARKKLAEDELKVLEAQTSQQEQIAKFSDEFLVSEIARASKVVENYEAVEDLTDKQQTELNLAKEYLNNLDAEHQFRVDNIQLQRELNEQINGAIDLQERLNLRVNNYNKARKSSEQDLSRSLAEANKALNTNFKTADDLQNYLLSKGDSFMRNLSKSQQDAINGLLDNWEAYGDAALADQENLIGLREQAGKFSQDEEENAEKAKQARLELYQQELARLISIKATEEEKLELEIKIRDLLRDQNDELDTQDQLAGDLLYKRQKAIEAMRGGFGSQAAVDAATENYRKYLQEQGYGPEEIARMMSQLPQFATGGPTSEGPAYLHDKEWVIKSQAVEKYGSGFMSALNNMQIPSLNSPASSYLSNSLASGSPVSFGNISITNNVSGAQSPAATANAIAEISAEKIIDIVNNGFRQRKIDTKIGGGR